MHSLFNPLMRLLSIRPGIVALLLVISLSNIAIGEDNLFRIQDSRIDVHKKASEGSGVTTQISANTQVILLTRQGEWCEILTFTSDVHGFVRCQTLGEHEVESSAIVKAGKSDGVSSHVSNPIDLFWEKPSVNQLLVVGDYFEEKYIEEAQLNIERGLYLESSFDENYSLEITRFPIEEFEAMKKRLNDGVMVNNELRPEFIRWSELRQVAREHSRQRRENRIQGRWFRDHVLYLMNEADMRPVSASLFTSFAELAPAGSSLEQLSAQFGIRHRVQIHGGPEWAHARHEPPMVAGSWDIGAFEQTLDEPVVEYAIGRQGQAAAMSWRPKSVRNLKEEIEAFCDEGIAFKPRASMPMSGYPLVKDPLVWLFTARALPYKQADIKTYARRLSSTGTDLLVIYEIDLDGDHIADLAAWEQVGDWRMEYDPQRKTRLGAQLFFANIAGSWHLLDYSEYTECA